MSACKRHGGSPRAEWDERAAALTRRRREETHRVVPQLTGVGILFALALFVLPALSAALSNVGWYVALIPIVAVGLLVALPLCWSYLGRALRRWRARSGAWQSDTRWSGFPALLTGQATTESRTLVTETPDPTSVEFERLFRELCRKGLSDSARRLVLVIDNLDRVAPGDALAIWSTLQTFVQQGATAPPAWATRLWIIVPFDPAGVERLWSNGSSEADTRAIVSSFLDKTFQVRFQIPPPTILHWRDYLRAALIDALPKHHEDDFHGVYRAVSLDRGHDAQPTPRDLRLLVNAIGALHRQWQDREGLTLPALACFALLGRDATRSALYNDAPNEHTTFAERVIGDRWRDALVTLYFGAPLADARVMLLRDAITSALDAGDGGALRELEATHGDGFWAVLEHSAPAGATDWGVVVQPDLVRGAMALDASGLFTEAPRRREAALVLARVRAAAVALDAWQPFDEEAAAGMAALCRLSGGDPEVTAALFRGATASEIPSLPAGGGPPLTWLRAAFALLAGTSELSPPPTLESPLSADQWLSVAPDIVDAGLDEGLWRRLTLQGIEAVDEALSTRLGIQEGPRDRRHSHQPHPADTGRRAPASHRWRPHRLSGGVSLPATAAARLGRARADRVPRGGDCRHRALCPARIRGSLAPSPRPGRRSPGRRCGGRLRVRVSAVHAQRRRARAECRLLRPWPPETARMAARSRDSPRRERNLPRRRSAVRRAPRGSRASSTRILPRQRSSMRHLPPCWRRTRRQVNPGS